MTRRKTDGYRLASKWSGEGILKGWYLDAASKEIDRLIRRRMGEAWDEGNVSPGYLKDNPYRKRRKK
jgi:hypothetical protein